MADTKNELTCPACGSKMEKVLIKHTGFNIDICLNGCGGIFFDNREFKYFDEKAENIKQIEKLTAGKEFIHASESLIRTCPACKSKMVKNYSSANKTIEIDECYICGGKFLDNQELQKIRAEYETEEDRSNAVIEAFVMSLPEVYANEVRQSGLLKGKINWDYVDTQRETLAIEEKIIDVEEFTSHE
ncbi:zf-TFIIB domain-containing protein [bacterium]|nr:zf-TFIIB domain-containing protein [bacterium]